MAFKLTFAKFICFSKIQKDRLPNAGTLTKMVIPFMGFEHEKYFDISPQHLTVDLPRIKPFYHFVEKSLKSKDTLFQR